MNDPVKALPKKSLWARFCDKFASSDEQFLSRWMYVGIGFGALGGMMMRSERFYIYSFVLIAISLAILAYVRYRRKFSQPMTANQKAKMKVRMVVVCILFVASCLLILDYSWHPNAGYQTAVKIGASMWALATAAWLFFKER
ncbi:MAG: hypothetical protein NT105_14475 [Verrucomicrobia bacterium]|nr:hypothetical protein [Verrucomicrobiota bacterium]